MVVANSELPVAETNLDDIHVLVIDDNPADRDFYARSLRDFGVTVSTAADGSEGRKRLGQGVFDCVLVDYRMPREDGLSVLNAIVADPSRPLTPVILMTGQGNEDLAVNAWKTGAADYLAKDSATPDAVHRAVVNAVEKSRLRHEVLEHAVELETANTALRRRNDEIRRFYHSISHELKTPLSAAREFLSLVQDGVAGPVTEQQKEYLEYAVESCDQLAEHFNDLVETTRLDNGKIEIRPKNFDLMHAVKRAMASTAQLARERKVDVATDIPDDLSKVHADENRIVQVLCNLLSNAIKNSVPGSVVRIEASADDAAVRVDVVDNGCGIEEEHHTGIFERLFQVPDAPNTNGGLGLGLAIAQAIVGLHGSEITVDSEPGIGSTFSFVLKTPHHPISPEEQQ